jgi:hypothetical protein
MSNNAVYDKRQVIGLLIGCAIALVVFHVAWINHFLSNMANPVFSIGYGMLMGANVAEAIGAYRYYKDDTRDWKRWAVVGITVALLAWLGFWASGKNDDKMFKQDVEKAKQSSQIIPIYQNEMSDIPSCERSMSFTVECDYMSPDKKVYFLNYNGVRCFFDEKTNAIGDNTKFLNYMVSAINNHVTDALKNCQFKVELFMVKDGRAGSFRIYDFQIKGVLV